MGNAYEENMTEGQDSENYENMEEDEEENIDRDNTDDDDGGLLEHGIGAFSDQPEDDADTFSDDEDSDDRISEPDDENSQDGITENENQTEPELSLSENVAGIET